ncbi:MAG: phospholipid carrier-dependent glycosyltransferase [Anaerolineae bacterium]|jgi:4-amino-4-deoxy-L-arabinose transferase-like glycosyltransferase|nr:phospholipid carrier-dependent glycosyltransferase [Anaerolineae bacterium]MBT4312490.1 phospholipid carrier-dependent glycosyltransferase [Anaerolineae bacterium]MBT4458748.1 phospholipid carrier-dependent glycosyltransferase [Anaerolineae bacterium]MBT4842242.1 phospholipid carrier-dependent glycosyltransferase [Anaerolineae bacterium]MBT6062880.1 phospholipid carrier-dependent glycosyltransferase [Anaerolineae bacterium]
MDRKTAFALVLGLLTATGIWLLAISTPHGLGLTDDAISYIAASRALLAGQGFTRIWLATGLEPITHWPPFFSFSLAVISTILKIDPYRSARVLNILVFGANAGILALLGYKMTKSRLVGIFLSILFLSNTALLRLHAQALSEPLYILVSLLAFSAFYRAFSEIANKQSKWLVIAGTLTGLSYLTRYAALSLIATFIIAIFILRPTWRKRFTSLAYFLAGTLPPILVWMLRNKLISGTATNRAIEWHPVSLENIQRGFAEFFSFLISLPELHQNWIENYLLLGIILSCIALVLLFWLLSRSIRYFLNAKENRPPEIISFLTILYIFSYMSSLLVSLSFFDAATPLNDRILSPVYLAIFVILVYFIHRLYQQGKIASRIFASGLILFFIGSSLIAQIRTVPVLQESATGFASWRWSESVVMAQICDLPADIDIYTNQPPAVFFWTGRAAYRLWDEQPESIRNGDDTLAIFFPDYAEIPEFQAWLEMMTEGLEPIQKSGLGNLYRKVE